MMDEPGFDKPAARGVTIARLRRAARPGAGVARNGPRRQEIAGQGMGELPSGGCRGNASKARAGASQ